jgi:predicted nucleotidyltransferase
MIEANFAELLPLLARHGVKFILIGGGAGIAHGLGRTTYDVDVVYARDEANLERVVGALRDHAPYMRGAPPGLPFRWDVATLARGLNFTLTTDIGNIDLLGEVAGGGTYEQLLPTTDKATIYGVECLVVGLEKLIHLKRAAGRPKDLEVLAELEVLLEAKRRQE